MATGVLSAFLVVGLLGKAQGGRDAIGMGLFGIVEGEKRVGQRVAKLKGDELAETS